MIIIMIMNHKTKNYRNEIDWVYGFLINLNKNK